MPSDPKIVEDTADSCLKILIRVQLDLINELAFFQMGGESKESARYSLISIRDDLKQFSDKLKQLYFYLLIEISTGSITLPGLQTKGKPGRNSGRTGRATDAHVKNLMQKLKSSL